MDAALDYLMAEEKERGKEIGAARVKRLGILLTEAGRVADFLKSLSDPVYQKKLFIEFGLEEKK